VSKSPVTVGKQWVLPWDGSVPYGWEDRRVLLRRRVPRLVRVELEARLLTDRVEIRHVHHPGRTISGDTEDLVGYLRGEGFQEGIVSTWAGTEAERLCRKVVQLTFREEENQEPEFDALRNHPFWAEFLQEVRDLCVVAEVMFS
jgi:hypothetical protein